MAFSGFMVMIRAVLTVLPPCRNSFDYRGKTLMHAGVKLWDAGLVVCSLSPVVFLCIALATYTMRAVCLSLCHATYAWRVPGGAFCNPLMPFPLGHCVVCLARMGDLAR